MFTGIIEATGTIISVRDEGTNRRFTIESAISPELKIDQSVSHDGVCLTVVTAERNIHEVVAIEETLKRSSLKEKKEGALLNLERSMQLNGRIDGHLVQGHVDDVAEVVKIKGKEGSWLFDFQYKKKFASLLVEKGSVCINGVSLTVVRASKRKFRVAIIPFTFENTNFISLKEADLVNVEFDIVGKYIGKWMKERA